MARRTLLLIASILTAALGTALIWLYVQGADQRAQQSADLVPVLFLRSDARSGTAAASLDVVTRPVPAAVAAGAITSLDQVRGLSLKIPAVADAPLLRTMFAATSASGLTPGGGAFSLTITDPNRVPASLQTGHHVAIYAYGGTSRTGRLIAKDIAVLSLGSTTQTPAASSGTQATVPATIVGFDADPQEAADLVGMLAASETPVLYDLGTGTAALPPSGG